MGRGRGEQTRIRIRRGGGISGKIYLSAKAESIAAVGGGKRRRRRGDGIEIPLGLIKAPVRHVDPILRTHRKNQSGFLLP